MVITEKNNLSKILACTALAANIIFISSLLLTKLL